VAGSRLSIVHCRLLQENLSMNQRTISMMQPYLFPYLGYFQLINAADIFVLGDDLQYTKESWINRNRILSGSEPKLISFPLRKDHFNARINERVFSPDFAQEKERLLRVIANAYCKAPQRKQVMALLEEIFKSDEMNMAKFAESSLKSICEYLGIRTPMVTASSLGLERDIDKQDRVIATARMFESSICINPIGGVELYDPSYFHDHHITLKFHRMHEISYSQGKHPFVPSLSIIDVIMFNDISAVRDMLTQFSLLSKPVEMVG
jgi:hypothetical protein